MGHTLSASEARALCGADIRSLVGALDLPPLSEEARTLLTLADADRTNPRVLSLIAQKDPVYMARLLALANSSVYGHLEHVVSIDAAIRRVGTQPAYAALLACAMAVGFPSNPEFTPYRKLLLGYAISMSITSKRVANWLDFDDARTARIVLASLLLPMGLLAGVLQPGEVGERFRKGLASHVSAGTSDFLNTPEWDGFKCYSAEIANRWRLSQDVVDVLAQTCLGSPEPSDGLVLCTIAALVACKMGKGDETSLMTALYHAAQPKGAPPSESLFADLAVLVM